MTMTKTQSTPLIELLAKLGGSNGKRISVNSVTGEFAQFAIELLKMGAIVTVADKSKASVQDFNREARTLLDINKALNYRTVPFSNIQYEPADIFIKLAEQDKINGRQAAYKQYIELGATEPAAVVVRQAPAAPALQANTTAVTTAQLAQPAAVVVKPANRPVMPVGQNGKPNITKA